ncbi:DsbA family oxidoreductase [Alicycliphilus sp. T452]|jgi:predicted DsbA family dithiol-disulfide isomerase
MNTGLTIDVYFDLICPWCLIGKRHLASALQQFRASRPDLQPQVRWHSFPLLPDTPLNGLPYQEFYEHRLGSALAVAARRSQVREAGRPAGIEFAFEKIAVMPNTLAAHRLIGLVAQSGDDALTERLIEKLFQGYFMEGRDIGDTTVLIAIANECGAALDDRQLTQALGQGRPRPSNHNVSGVPYYVFNHRLALSGAQPPDVLLKAMLQSLD